MATKLQTDNTLLIRPGTESDYQWYKPVVAGSGALQGGGSAAQLADVCQGNISPVLIVPAGLVTLTDVEFVAAERKLLAQTVPYSLEEDISGPIEALHFALGTPQTSDEKNNVAVAAVDRNVLQRWIDELLEVGIECRVVIPEQLLLPWQEDSWSIWVEDGRWVVKPGPNAGFEIEQANSKFALQLLLDESEIPPLAIHLYAQESQLASIQSQVPDCIPELVRNSVEWHPQTYWATVAQAWQQGELLNLLQGEFARSLPWKKWWQQWRSVAAVAVVALAVQLAFGYFSVRSLEQENLALRQQIEQTYRQAIPAGRVVEPERQLRRQVNALRGGGGEGFTTLFAKVAEVIAAKSDISLQAMNYNERQSEIRMTLLAPSFNLIESLRAGIEQQGLQAELTGSSNDNGKTRARLKINGQG